MTGVEADWFIGLLILGGFLIFIASPILGGPTAVKWVLEGSLMFFTLLLVLSVPVEVTTFDQVQFVFSVSGAVLATIYLGWLRLYILNDEDVDANTLREALDTFEYQTEGVWALWGTVVYFVFSSIYVLIGYVTVFILLNS